MARRITLLDVAPGTEQRFALSVAIGGEPPRTYSAYVDPDPRYRAVSLDEPLFFELSELSQRRYGDCTRYHIEVCFLLTAFARGDTVELPAVLGATRFARPPSRWRRFRNHVRRLLRV